MDKDVDRVCRSLIWGFFLVFSWRNWGKIRNTSRNIVDAQAEKSSEVYGTRMFITVTTRAFNWATKYEILAEISKENK
jgi:hypothetical protein